MHGILTLRRSENSSTERWRLTRARDVMRPIAPRFFVGTLYHARLRPRVDETKRRWLAGGHQ